MSLSLYAGDVTNSLTTLVSSWSVAAANLSDAQLKRYGQYTLAAAACFYLASSLQSPVPADAKYAIDAHLPQGYDRSVIASRLQQRSNKQALLDCLRIQQLRDALRSETQREAKLKGWELVLERTLVGMLAGAYTHSLTLSLFAIKNTVRVLVFVLQRREETEAAKSGHAGPLGKVRAWWSGGTQSLIMESLMERMNDQLAKQASPFAHMGLDEEPVPSPVGASSSPSSAAPMDGHASFSFSRQMSRELASGPLSEDEAADEEEGQGQGRVGRDVMNGTRDPLDSSRHRWAVMAEAERLFSVKDIMQEAIPRIVATAERVVRHVLAAQRKQDPKRFSVAGSVTAHELRVLLVDLCEEMERSACVAAWLAPSVRNAAALGAEAGRDSGLNRKARYGAKEEEGDMGQEDDDIVRFPAGSTAILGPDGRPVPKTSHLTSGRRAGGSGTSERASAQDESEDDDADDTFAEASVFYGAGMAHMGLPLTPAERRAQRQAQKQEARTKQQTAAYFQEIIHSASFAELCLQYASSTLADVMYEAADITGVKSYDATLDAAKVLMVIPSLEGHRQRALDTTEFEIPPSMRLFCEEMVRLTCANN